MRERNRRAREYSRMCRTRRWCRRMWVVAIVLWVMLLVLVAWCLTLPEVQEDVVQSPPTAEIAEPETENVLVCDITGYCACCTPYAHMNQRDGKVLTASGLWVDIGEAVAVDPDIIPLGSTVTLGGKTYIAADTGVYGYTVDVLMSHEDAAQAGVVKALVSGNDRAGEPDGSALQGLPAQTREVPRGVRGLCRVFTGRSDRQGKAVRSVQRG